MTSDFVVISCGKKKAQTRAVASRLYTSTQFKCTLTYALSIARRERVRVLSAKHGLLKLADVLEPYDCTWGDAGCISTETVAKQVASESEARWLLFMPKHYCEFFELVVPDAIRIKPRNVNMFTLCSWTRAHLGKVICCE